MTASAVTADGRARVLADRNQMPMLGLGVWQVPNGPASVNAVRWALDLGYRHIDTAQAYGNEESVGKALHDSGLPREEVFITTKFYPARDDPVAEARQSLRRLGVDQVDLYLVHWPQGGPVWAWPGMKRARELGYAQSVGVSNFSALVPSARTPGHHQVNPPRANPRERAGLRLRLVSGGHDRPRRARPDQRHRPRAGR